MGSPLAVDCGSAATPAWIQLCDVVPALEWVVVPRQVLRTCWAHAEGEHPAAEPWEVWRGGSVPRVASAFARVVQRWPGVASGFEDVQVLWQLERGMRCEVQWLADP